MVSSNDRSERPSSRVNRATTTDQAEADACRIRTESTSDDASSGRGTIVRPYVATAASISWALKREPQQSRARFSYRFSARSVTTRRMASQMGIGTHVNAEARRAHQPQRAFSRCNASLRPELPPWPSSRCSCDFDRLRKDKRRFLIRIGWRPRLKRELPGIMQFRTRYLIERVPQRFDSLHQLTFRGVEISVGDIR